MTIGEISANSDYTPPSGSIVPAGIYNGIASRVTKKEFKKDKSNPDSETFIYIEVEQDIVAPSEYANRKRWDTFWIQGEDQKRAEMERKRFGNFINACGVPSVSDETLHTLEGKETRFEITVSPPKDGKEAKNWFRKYHAVGTTDEQILGVKRTQASSTQKAGWGKPAEAAPAQAAQPATAAATKPWARKS